MSDVRIQNVQPRVYNGKYYRSTLEAKTAKVLDELGIPHKYEERKIILFKGFHCPYQKEKVRDLTYTPDFEIGDNILLECKGFETPEWKIKKKLVFKYLLEREPATRFYQIHDAGKQLIEMLDHNWTFLGFAIQVIPKPSKKEGSVPSLFSSVTEAMQQLGLKGKPIGKVLKSLTRQVKYVYNYNWSLIKLDL